MRNIETNLYEASLICEGMCCYNTEFSKIYPFTTENISGYIDYFDLNNKSLLTVGSSGDQILNAFYNGARDITLFDINEYAKYYVYLKISAILSLSYNEFKLFFFKHTTSPFKQNEYMFSKEIFKKIKENLRIFDYESYLFFDELFSLYEGSIIRDRLFDDDEDRNKVIIKFNKYLKDEESYNKLQSIIREISFKYIQGNFFEDDINGKYENIFLSNLCSITSLEKLKKLLEKLDRNNLKNAGSILVGYLWNTNFHSDEFSDDWKEIYKLPIVREYLKKFITNHYQINGARDILWQEDKKGDLVLVYRKK
ncbi:MAG: DUF3419 family protein [Firmicutes bacterium]|nr:DUF3419 family protein [Bacillota bacterium]